MVPLPFSPRQHGIEENSQTPDIDGCVVALLLQHLRSHEISRVARSHQQAVLGSKLLGEAEVSDAESVVRTVGLGVEDVGWLQVSVDHALLVEMLDGRRLREGKEERGRRGWDGHRIMEILLLAMNLRLTM